MLSKRHTQRNIGLTSTSNSFLVRRTCTQKSGKSDEQGSRPLEAYRELPAYVLLGDPGAGKTKALELEAEEASGKYIKARDFATFSLGTEYQGKTLFIDALDEMRADGSDGRTPLDHIRSHLERLGRPCFRLSCREADWLGASDSEALMRISPNGQIVALHLDPLTDENVIEILRQKYGIPDANAFVCKADEHGLSELLRNPQTLSLLVEAVGDNEWPQSRGETYELACRQLVREKNLEHRQAKREKTSPADTLLDAAGHLCAVSLLSGIAGFALDEDAADTQHFYWKELPAPSDQPLFPTLKTNLFQGDGEERRIPVHRSVAEYLGARYLAALVENHGLPFGRVMALMTGEDGGIVADLRGLAAWLSVHCRTGRMALIERDPLGVVLYGDVRNFIAEDKQGVLTALHSEARRYPWFRSEDWTSPPFGALGTPDMVPAFNEILASPSREDADQALLDCVLEAICYGETLPALEDPLEVIARDGSYRQVVRKNALRALMHGLPDNALKLLKLAEEIRSGLVEDQDDEILGILLSKLYPHFISSTQILDYLHLPKHRELIGSYSMFWQHELPESTNSDELPLLLDQLAQRRADLRTTLDGHQTDRMAGKLLVRGLEYHGDAISAQRLYEWLSVGLDEYDHPSLDGKNVTHIAQWFADRPHLYKAVISYGASLCVGRDNIQYCMYQCTWRFQGASPPADIVSWYLEMAATERKSELAHYYFEQAVISSIRESRQEYLTLQNLEFFDSWTEMRPSFQPWLNPFISCDINDWQRKDALRERERKDKRQKLKDDMVRHFREHFAAILDGSAYPKILHDLAMAYEGLFYEVKGETPHERLVDFLGGDMELVGAAYEGFRRALARKDLPSVAEIINLELNGRMHYIRLACLIGMDELYQSAPSAALQLDDAVLSRLLAFRLTYHVGKDPSWFTTLIQERPALAAEVLVAYALPMLRAGKEHIAGLYPLAYDSTYARIAPIALPELLAGFPLRSLKHQLGNALDPLLKGGLRYLDRNILSSIIAHKLEQSSMDAAQRVYWLSCGLMITPNAYEAPLARHIGKSKVRRGYLASFLHSHGERRFPNSSLPETTLALLIELLAPTCAPERPEGAYWVSPAMQTAEVVRSFVSTLGGNPSEAASFGLERLMTLPNLSNWRNLLHGALHSHRIAKRKATFHRQGAEEVCHTLANLQPANATDLAALTFNHMRDIARRIRDGSTNDYRQYWSYDKSNKKLDKPKPENDCRDALLSDLGEWLGRLSVDAQKEGYYAEDKRADIRVSFGGAKGFNVPIEIKKDSHANLWSAIHEQLIARYARDPGTEGNGIYLVFWFGGKGMSPPPDGKKPHSAIELENKLLQTLTKEETHRILICVIDCSLP